MEVLSPPPSTAYTSAAASKHTQATYRQLSPWLLRILATKGTSLQFMIDSKVEKNKTLAL